MGDDQFKEIAISQGFRIGDVIIVSGQTAVSHDHTDSQVSFETQGDQAFLNLKRVLEAGGSSLDDVVKVTIFVTDMSYYETIVKLRRKYFSAPYPADTLVGVTTLARPEWMIEIEAIAMVRQPTST